MEKKIHKLDTYTPYINNKQSHPNKTEKVTIISHIIYAQVVQNGQRNPIRKLLQYLIMEKQENTPALKKLPELGSNQQPFG